MCSIIAIRTKKKERSVQLVNRSKGSIMLDLKKLEAVQLVKRLVEDYDILAEQFSPGVMERKRGVR